jgi:hypothetical protein
MFQQSTTLTVVGFILAFLGGFSLFLNLVGVDLYILRWLYDLGGLLSVVTRLGMVILGFVLIYVSRVDWDREEI